MAALSLPAAQCLSRPDAHPRRGIAQQPAQQGPRFLAALLGEHLDDSRPTHGRPIVQSFFQGRVHLAVAAGAQGQGLVGLAQHRLILGNRKEGQDGAGRPLGPTLGQQPQGCCRQTGRVSFQDAQTALGQLGGLALVDVAGRLAQGRDGRRAGRDQLGTGPVALGRGPGAQPANQLGELAGGNRSGRACPEELHQGRTVGRQTHRTEQDLVGLGRNLSDGRWRSQENTGCQQSEEHGTPHNAFLLEFRL